MKINEGQGITVSPELTQNQSKKSVNGEFQKVMEQVIQAGENKDAAESKGIDPLINDIMFLSGTKGIEARSPSLEKQMVITELQETMNLIDFYASKLADPSRPLSTIDPLIEHIEQRLENLKTIESSPGLPDQLKPIISDMIITIGTEITKYKTGSYA